MIAIKALFRPLFVIGTLGLCVMAPNSGQAQTIPTPFGELHIGMTKDELTGLFGNRLEELKDSEGHIYARRVADPSNTRSFYIFLTSRGRAYSILSIEWTPRDTLGAQAAENAFDRYLKAYASPEGEKFARSGEAVRKVWRTSEHMTVEVLLGCHRTEVMVKISDYERLLADDKIDEIHPKSTFNDWGSMNACFF